MDKPTLAVYLFGYNLNLIAYPWIASIESALELAGRHDGSVFLCECYSADDTWQAAQTLAAKHPKLVLLRHPWADKYYQNEGGAEKPDGYKIQAVIGNFILDQIGTRFKYALKLDADEVLHESSFSRFAFDLHQMDKGGFLLGKPHYSHFCPDDQHTFNFIYDSKAVICNTSAGFRFSLGPGGDACALGGAPEFPTTLEVFHYGKMHMGRRRESLVKEHEFQKLYVERGFPDEKVVKLWNEDGYMDYTRVFIRAVNEGEFKKFNGAHPKFVQGWLKDMREREERWWQEYGK